MMLRAIASYYGVLAPYGAATLRALLLHDATAVTGHIIAYLCYFHATYLPR